MTEAYESVNEIMEKAVRAAAIFSQLDQEHTDRIVRAVYEAALENRVKLAKMAHEETGIGKWEDKVIKNVVATQLVYEDIKDLKTVGIIHEDFKNGLVEIAQPLGPILAVTPVTNPTSTVIFKILICLKTRNPIVITPHWRAAKCSIETARVCCEAAAKEDAPEDCIQWVEHGSRKLTSEAMKGHVTLERLKEEAYSPPQLIRTIMRNRKFALILATGEGKLVKEAYSSGNPALGVGSGNVPVFIEKSADIPFAIQQIFESKTFDNGTFCASEQAIVVEKSIAGEVIDEFKKSGAYFLSEEEAGLLEKVVFNSEEKRINTGIIGKAAKVIAEMAGFSVNEDTRILIASLKGIGDEHPLSREILAPILAFYVADDFEQAVNLCIEVNFFGGIGHTASIFSNDEDKIQKFSNIMNVGRIVVNTPSTQGGIGGIYNTLAPSLTLGCGTAGKNITTDNITAKHLLNIQRIARRRVNERFGRFDKRLYLDDSISADEIEKEYNRNY